MAAPTGRTPAAPVAKGDQDASLAGLFPTTDVLRTR